MTVGVLPQLQAVIAFLIPLTIVLLALSARAMSLRDIAPWVPAVVAIDLLTCILASRVVTLDSAFLGSRVIWLLAGGAWLFHQRTKLRRPFGGSWRQAAIVMASAAAAFAFSAAISRNYSIWDRQFHIPLVTAIRGQRLPFLTAFQFNTIFHYHFAGDVLASAFQTFSGGRLHASLALAIAHDVTFGLTGLCLSAWLVSSSTRRIWLIPAVLSVFLTGPFGLLRPAPLEIAGYSFLNFLCMSFRPHVSLSCLLLAGVMIPIFTAATDRRVPQRAASTCIALCILALGITDEASAALAGFGLAVTWLVFPEVLHPSRKRGAFLLVASALGVLLINWVFQTAMAPGGPVQNVRLVPWRSPGFTQPPLPLSGSAGLNALLTDVGPYLLIFVALIGYSFRERRHWSVWALPVFCGAVLLASTFALTRIEVNSAHLESHRFMTVTEVLLAMIAIALLPSLPTGAWERLPLFAALFLSSASTLVWARNGMGPPEEYFTNYVDCRESAGAHLWDSPKPTYIAPNKWFWYAGCRSVFFPGVSNGWTSLQTGGPAGGRIALQTLHDTFLQPKDLLTVACSIGDLADPVCAKAHGRPSCRPNGTLFEVCQLSPDDRREVLSQPW